MNNVKHEPKADIFIRHGAVWIDWFYEEPEIMVLDHAGDIAHVSIQLTGRGDNDATGYRVHTSIFLTSDMLDSFAVAIDNARAELDKNYQAHLEAIGGGGNGNLPSTDPLNAMNTFTLPE